MKNLKPERGEDLLIGTQAGKDHCEYVLVLGDFLVPPAYEFKIGVKEPPE